jgi:hypothetical protein
MRHSRHAFGTLLKANREDVATVQALMRHANVSVTRNMYFPAVTPAKRKAQRGIIKQIREVARMSPDPNLKYLQVLEKMVGAIGFEFWGRRIFNNIESHGGHRKAVEDDGKLR